MQPNQEALLQLKTYQRTEITEHHIYKRLAKSIKTPENRRIIEKIAEDELHHYHEWKKYTQADVKPDMFVVWKYTLIGLIFWVYIRHKINGAWGRHSPEKLFGS
jgi:hypothetical protein